MSGDSLVDALGHWATVEARYENFQSAVEAFQGEAAAIGASMIIDVPTRMEYMKMIDAEAKEALARARTTSSPQAMFEHINARRDELRLIQQDKAGAPTRMLSKLITKQHDKYQLLVKSANSLARQGKLPAIGVGEAARSIPLEELSPEQLDDVFLEAINRAGGSRKTITPTNMKMRGAGLLLLSVALAGLDIYMSEDKNFAVTKNVASAAGGAGGAWAGAAAGLALGGPVGGLIGLIAGGIIGSYAAEEAHFHIRGLHADPKIDQLVAKYNGIINFDEEGLGRALHIEFDGNLGQIALAFANLNEKRSSDADDVAYSYIEVAQEVVRKHPNGVLATQFKSPMGTALLDLLYSTLDGGWTTDGEYAKMAWLMSMKSSTAK